MNCGATTLDLGQINLLLSTSITTTPLSSTIPVSSFHLNIDDFDPNLVHLQSKPLSSYLIHKSGCPATYPPTIIPKYLPYIEDMLYYVVGHDSLLNLGVKSFGYLVNASHALLDSCQ